MRAGPLIDRLRASWHAETGPSGLRAALALGASAVVLAILLARVGTWPARIGALSLLVTCAAPLLWRRRILARRRSDARVVMQTTLTRTDPKLAASALRAFKLTEQATATPARHGSPELAELHLTRLLTRASLDPITALAHRHAWMWSGIALAAAAAAFTLVVLDPYRMIEGVGVLTARNGVAPLNVDWVDNVEVVAEPPAYLAKRRKILYAPFFPTALPLGTEVKVRARALRPDRKLFLSDGNREVPFVDAGDGALIAHWTVEDDESLRVVSAFGDVRIEEGRSLEIHGIADLAPFVALQGAPRRARLLDETTIPIHYEAIDDHGLREIALVLRAGIREERRVLSEPKGGTRREKGGLVLRSDDPFLKRSYLPVQITVEARDGDPVSGPKWGVSEGIIIVPPRIGEREAWRHQALKTGRDALTDMLAARLLDDDFDGRRAHASRESLRQGIAIKAINDALDGDYGGLWMPGRVRAMVRGQLERLDKALVEARQGDTESHHAELVKRTASVLLAIDAALDALGYNDTQTAARQLADVAQEAADSIEASRQKGERRRAVQRLEAALEVLEGGGSELVKLGALGADLGEIVDNGLRRIRRAWDAGDRHHARLAAEDLAARLRMPDPSFNSQGGGGHGGVESGGRESSAEGDASEAAKEAAELMRELDKLRQEHNAETNDVKRALDEAMSESDNPEMAKELAEQAEKVREAIKDLPRMGNDADSARSAAASARAKGESMAGALEQSKLSEAVERGEDAVEALRNAEQRARDAPDGSEEKELGREAREAREALEDILQEAKQAQKKAGKQASEQVGGALDQAAKRERALAERARQLRDRSQSGEAPLPGEMLRRLGEAARAMDRAADQLQKHRGPRGLEEQQKAQRLLEMSQPDSDQPPQGPKQPGDSDDMAKDADVPKEKRDERADDFRKRVTDGLKGDVPPHLRDALRRYTEGLLR